MTLPSKCSTRWSTARRRLPQFGRSEALMAFTTSNGRTQTALADINITPLVDVVLVLLIIFMVTAPVLQSGIDVSVPENADGESRSPKSAW